MKSNLTTRLYLLVAMLLLAVGVTKTVSAQSAYSVTLQNVSGYGLYHVYLSPSGNPFWGPDQLGSSVIQAGFRGTLLQQFPSGTYDLRLVDEDGDDCIVPGVQVTGSTTWNIYHDWLLNCEFH